MNNKDCNVKVKKDILFEMSITKVLEKIILIKIFSFDYMSKIIKIKPLLTINIFIYL